MVKFAEYPTGELQALRSCTLGSAPSVSKARKRSLGDWVFLDSRIGPHPSPIHQRPGPQNLRRRPLVAHTAQEGVVRQGVVRISRNVDGLHREGVEHVEEAADVVRVRVAHHESSVFIEREAPTSNGPPNTPVTSTDPSGKAINLSRIIL